MRETNSPVNQPVQSDADVETTIGLTDLWSMCITRWYWFLLSLVVALVVAVVYLMSAPVVYTRNASVLVKGRNSLVWRYAPPLVWSSE